MKMTVQGLIDKLNEVKDKSLMVAIPHEDGFEYCDEVFSVEPQIITEDWHKVFEEDEYNDDGNLTVILIS